MVYPDDSLICIHKKNQTKYTTASALQRLLSVVLDYFILSPMISFICMILFSEGLKLYRQFPSSAESTVILFQVGVGFIFLFTLLQALFIFFAGGTPGQIFTKIFINFDNDNSSQHISLFFQAWLRQVGFVFSILFLGVPFLAVFYHPKRRTVYERMTESSVLTYVQKPFEILNWGNAERRYISVFISLFLFSTVILSAFSFNHFYQKILSSNLTYEKLNKEKHFCKELDSIQQENRLTVAMALNLVGVLSDRCLDIEADFILWRSPVKVSKSMAYFAKYITAESDGDENKYLKKTCDENKKSEACHYARAFRQGDFQQLVSVLNSQSAELGSNVLSDILRYEALNYLKIDSKKAFKTLEKYSTFKLVNKYLITEQLSYLLSKNTPQKKQNSLRSPANDEPFYESENLSEKIKQIQKRIDDL